MLGLSGNNLREEAHAGSATWSCGCMRRLNGGRSGSDEGGRATGTRWVLRGSPAELAAMAGEGAATREDGSPGYCHVVEKMKMELVAGWIVVSPERWGGAQGEEGIVAGDHGGEGLGLGKMWL